MRDIKVEMRPAYQWTCDECGREHFESAMIVEMSNEERLSAAKAMGIIDESADVFPEDEYSGHFLTQPARVMCPDCDSVYETQCPFDDCEVWDLE